MYVGENFAVQTPEWFNVPVLVTNTSIAGVVVTKFFSSRELKKMQLTVGGYRLLSVPNAGGSSVVSEVLSFELLNKCFSAKLKKVCPDPLPEFNFCFQNSDSETRVWPC